MPTRKQLNQLMVTSFFLPFTGYNTDQYSQREMHLLTEHRQSLLPADGIKKHRPSSIKPKKRLPRKVKKMQKKRTPKMKTAP